MSRYLERVEHTARVLEVQFNLMLERGAHPDNRHWEHLGRSLGLKGADLELGSALPAALGRDVVNRSSIVSGIMLARENARQVREQISSEMWEQLNRLFHEVKRTPVEDVWESGPIDFLESIKEGIHLFHGITDSTITHNEGWRFIQVGRSLERAVSISTLVSAHFREFHQPAEQLDSGDHFEWIGLLKSCTAFEAFCKVYTADLTPERIAEFLILHPAFPHSIHFAAIEMERALREIGDDANTRRAAKVERIAGKLRAALSFGQIDEIMLLGLHSYLDGIRRQCADLHSALHQVYITYPVEAAIEG
jgi:uncharacterized alpha-E superfamily protein